MTKRLGTDGKLTETGAGGILNNMVTLVAARYVVAMKQLNEQGGDPAAAWNQLRECCRDVLALQRGEQQAQRIELDWEKLAFGREKVRAGMVMYLWKGSGGRPPENLNDEARMTNGTLSRDGREGNEAPRCLRTAHQPPSAGEIPSAEVQDAAGAKVAGEKVRPVEASFVEDEDENDPPALRRGATNDELVIRVNPGESDPGILKNRMNETQEEGAPWESAVTRVRTGGPPTVQMNSKIQFDDDLPLPAADTQGEDLVVNGLGFSRATGPPQSRMSGRNVPKDDIVSRRFSAPSSSPHPPHQLRLPDSLFDQRHATN